MTFNYAAGLTRSEAIREFFDDGARGAWLNFKFQSAWSLVNSDVIGESKLIVSLNSFEKELSKI